VTVRPTTGGPPFDLTCHAVILATGAANHLSQAWDIAGEPIMGASLSLYAQGAPLAGLEFRFADNLKPGYAWAFPMVTGLNIGVCALGPTSAATLRARAAIFAQGWSAANATWRGGGHALWSGNGTTWHHPAGVVSCGDAAGLTDPHSAEGITAALKSGAAAGAAIARFLKRRSARALASYSAWVKAFGTDRYQRLSAELLLWRIWAGA
jgi:flavin-dependent dehydrogenase